MIYILACFLLCNGLQAQVRKAVAPPSAIPVVPIPDSATGSAASIAAYLKSHTTDQTALLRSLYAWMADHIVYDVVNTFRPDYYKDTTDAIVKTLQTRAGVCQGYAALYMAVCRAAHIPAWLVTGYTITNGKLDNASHAWVAVYVNNQWQFTDPTWGAGYVNGNRYVQQLNWRYFMVLPSAFIRTHVPFDPLFQLLDHPFRHDEIRDGRLTEAAGRPVFNYSDTLRAFNAMGHVARAANEVARIERYGITNQFTSVEVNYLHNVVAIGKQNEQVLAQNQLINRVNEGSSMYNEAVNAFNSYVQFKNHQFSPARPDDEIRAWIDGVARKLDETVALLGAIPGDDAGVNRTRNEILAAATDLKQRVAGEQAFVSKYIRTGRMFRKSLFYKVVF